MLSLEVIKGYSQMLSARKTRHLTTTTKTTTKALKRRNCCDIEQSKDGKAHLKSGPHLLVEVCIRDMNVPKLLLSAYPHSCWQGHSFTGISVYLVTIPAYTENQLSHPSWWTQICWILELSVSGKPLLE